MTTIQIHAVHHQIAHALGRPASDVPFSATLADLGQDDHDAVALTVDLNKAFGVRLGDDAIRDTSTVVEVIGAVRDAATAAEQVAL